MKNLNKVRFLSSVAFLIIITFLVFTNLSTSAALFKVTQLFLSEYLGWFIILIANGFVIFSTYLIFTKYKNIRLGGNDAIPAYSYVNWIAMLFSAGLGIGQQLLFGVWLDQYHVC